MNSINKVKIQKVEFEIIISGYITEAADGGDL